MNPLSEYSTRWFPANLNHDTGFHQIVSANLSVLGKMLDLGCGDNGSMARYRTANREVWGSDFTAHPELKHPAWFRSLHADGSIPFPSDTFDLVSSFMVMEHVTAPDRFFGEIARVLKPNGLYVGQSIHSLHYVTWIRRLFDLVPHRWVQCLVKKLYGREEHDTFPTVYRLNRRGRIARAARTYKLESVRWQGYASQGYFEFSPLLFRGATLVDWALEKMYPGLGMIYFTVVLRKAAAVAQVEDIDVSAQAA